MMTTMYNALHLPQRPSAVQWEILSSLKRALHQTKLNLFLFLLLFLANSMLANNIQVSNVVLTGKNTTDNFAMVRFAISWENSWRVNTGPSNWDAAWVFVKFQVGARNPVLTGASSSGATITVNSTTNLRVGMPVVVSAGTGSFTANTTISSITNNTQFEVSATPDVALSGATVTCQRIWEHGTLNTTAGNHTAPTGSTIDVPSDGVGAFIFRSANGTGTFSLSEVRLRWEYGLNGVDDNAIVQVQVFAIEMVYVPGGVDFNVGGGDGTYALTSTTINTAVANTVPAGSGSLGGQAGGYPTGQNAPDANWPNGYNAFFSMKYEISQGQYRDFLNTLTYHQQSTRTTSSPNSATGVAALSNDYRNGLDIQTPGNATALAPALYGCNLNGNSVFNEANDGEWIACNWLSWMDGCAYMDWAGLRPMTELEFEKACRGNQVAIFGEYAWGTISIFGAVAISNGGANNESFSDVGVNCAYRVSSYVQGPIRVGSLANSSTTREQSGASYYGIMEMSGNVWERTVTIENVAGRSYTGLHGNGILFGDGNANVDFWPGINGNSTTTVSNTVFIGTTGVTQAAGSGIRGGGWNDGATNAGVSDRFYAVSVNTIRSNDKGFRGVRTVP